MNPNIVTYYRDRAEEYEKIYHKPERRHDLLLAEKILQDTFSGKDVFEAACGTGYWTQKIAATAKSIRAIDINDTVLEIAKSKSYSPAKVYFQTADLFEQGSTHVYESLFGGFIWSHIKVQDLPVFLNIIAGLVVNSGTIVFMDNCYVEGSNLPIGDQDDSGNTYQIRTLENGTRHKVLKNFPSEIFIRQQLEDRAVEVEFIRLKYYWIVKYKRKASTP